MLKRLWVSLKRDFKMNLTNGYLLITVAVALLYMLVVRFAVPEQLSTSARLYLYDATTEQTMANYAQSFGEEQAVLVYGETELTELMAENENSVGLILTEGDPLPQVRLVFQAAQGEQIQQLMLASLESELRALYGVEASDIEVSTRLLNEAYSEPIPLDKSLVTVLLYSDPVMIGLLFVAALYFVERQQGTVKAYLVTPGRVWEYVLAKALSLALLAVLFTLILVPFTVSSGVNYAALLGLVFMGSILSSLAGTLLASFYTDLGQFFAPGVLVILFLSLPGISYYVPSFSPWWLRLHPTYSMLFGMKEALFPSGNPQIIVSGILVLLALDIIMLAVSSLALDRQFVRR